jgi:hypothetical protein
MYRNEDATKGKGKMTSTARIQNRYQVRGIRPDGGKLAFPILAWDYEDAVKVANQKAKGGTVTDIVLKDGNEKQIQARAQQIAKGM